MTLRELVGVERLGKLRLGFGSLGIEDIDIHMRDHLPRLHKVALIGDDVANSAWRLGRDVDLDRLDPAVAADDALGQSRRLEEVPEQQAGSDHRIAQIAQTAP
ncbi:MAG: hypothetical protein K0R64_3702 [Novosphingobium lindaniclasticum]|nr:hypothetical protein [Novosphingobium lindaniclasticum]